MAEKDKKEEKQSSGKKDDEAPAAEGAAPKNNKKKLIIIGGGVAALVFLIGMPVLFFTLKSKPAASGDADPTGAIQSGTTETASLEGAKDEDQLDENEEHLGAIFPMETFVVNLTGGKYIRCQLQLEFVDRDIPARFYTKLVPIRDGLITLLTKKTQEDVLSEKGKDQLKKEVKDTINELLRKEDVRNVYFTQFVVQ